MSIRHLLGTVLFLAATIGLILFLSRDRGDATEGPAPTTQSPDPASPDPDSPPETDVSEPPTAGADSPAQPAIPNPPRLPVSQFSTQKVALEVSEAHGDEVLESVLRPLGYGVSIADSAWALFEEIDVTLTLEDVSVTTVLALTLEPYGLTWKVQDDVLWVLLPGEEPPETVR